MNINTIKYIQVSEFANFRNDFVSLSPVCTNNLIANLSKMQQMCSFYTDSDVVFGAICVPINIHNKLFQSNMTEIKKSFAIQFKEH